MNNMHFMNQMNNGIFYKTYNNQFYNNSKTYNIYNFSQNNNMMNFRNFKKKRDLFLNQSNANNKTQYIRKETINDESKENNINDNDENIYLRINKIKMAYHKKNSVNAICDCSFNSSTSDEEHEDSFEEKDLIEFKTEKSKKRRLSNTSGVSTCPSNSSNQSFKTKFEEKKLNKNLVKNDNDDYKGNPQYENTEILKVNVKISKDKFATFKLKRYDDVFETIKLFCEINSVDEKLIKPLIIKSLSTLNTIYQIVNCKLEKEQINLLKQIKNI
jgi:hypothetical protein